ncbi:MAG: right-handed parallel beta-helix repeat-containing protein, partial [Thermoplasmata archaeon]|nr:right-handed parallel beta-helix repeat-containing protein [Thermoplasmata archaeon]
MINSNFYAPNNYDGRYPGLDMTNCSEISIKNNTFSGYDNSQYASILFGSVDPGEGEYPPCSNVEIFDNTFDNCRRAIYSRHLENASIHNNKFTDIYRSIWIRCSLNNSRIYENSFENSVSDRFDEGIRVIANNSKIYKNTFTNVGCGISLLGKDSSIHNNTFTDVTYKAIIVEGSNQKIVDNTMEGASVEYKGGIGLKGDRHTVARNSMTKFTGAINTYGNVTNTTIEDNQIDQCDIGVITSVCGTHKHVTMNNNEVRDATRYAFGLGKISDSIFKNNRIIECKDGILFEYGCFDNTITGNTIRNYDGYTGHGVSLGEDWMRNSNERNFIAGNIITGKHYAIYLRGYFDENYGAIRADNNIIRNNNLSWNTYGIHIEGGSNNTIMENTILNCGQDGINISYTNVLNVNFGGHNNKVEKNRISTMDNGCDLHEDCLSKTTNEYRENTIGTNYPTTFSLEGFDRTMYVSSVEAPPKMPQPPMYPVNSVNISNFVDIFYSSGGAPFYLTFHYRDEQLMGLKEDNLEIWRWVSQANPEDKAWSLDEECKVWKLPFPGHNTGNNEIYVQTANSIPVLESAIYAPLINAQPAMPVHNLNTSEDFATIQNAIDDSDTGEGNIIEVEDGTYTENVEVTKRLTIRSRDGSENCTVQANDPEMPVFNLSADGINIRGFTIRGAEGSTAEGSAAGVYVSGVTGVTVSDCNITNNGIG